MNDPEASPGTQVYTVPWMVAYNGQDVSDGANSAVAAGREFVRGWDENIVRLKSENFAQGRKGCWVDERAYAN